MFHPRRVLRGVLLAMSLLLFGISTQAQQSFLRADSDVPPLNSSHPRPTPSCTVSEAASNATLATLRDLLAAKTSIAGCRGNITEAAVAATRTLASTSLVLSNKDAVGKKAQSILAARAGVLDILTSENACAQWFRGTDADPAHVFQTLSFTLDAKELGYVIASTRDNRVEEWIHPYVATVTQNGGEFQAVTLNTQGAFFRSAANVMRLPKEGGPLQFDGTKVLKVGPYLGNTPRAQLTTMLHELGHVLGLLPMDAHDANGQSAANTAEVLRHCQPEIESAAKEPRF